jgi:glucoamylase
MFANINVPGAANGTVMASQSRADPNYAYNWVRDAALTMDTVFQFYAAATTPTAKSYYETILFQYAQARAAEQNDPDLAASLGEPKFNLDNSVFTGPWGRPQVSCRSQSSIA